MAFIQENDLYKVYRKEYIDEIKRDDPAIVEHSISSAIGEVKAYLRETFDVATIFSKTDTERDSLLVTFCADIAVYNLIDIAPVGADIEQKRLRHKRAIEWLQAVQKGDLIPDLPRLENSITQTSILSTSTEKKEMRY
jgi:phage gp36-like protein